MTSELPTCIRKALSWKQPSIPEDWHNSRMLPVCSIQPSSSSTHAASKKGRGAGCRSQQGAPAPAKSNAGMAVWSAGVTSRLNSLEAGAHHMWLTFTVTEGM